MCSNRNLFRCAHFARSILDHWEMCSNRNQYQDLTKLRHILDHWEMCSNRNKDCNCCDGCGILDHWEMCSNRNFDVVPLRNGKPVWGTTGEDLKLWQRIGEIGKSCGLEWAGDWRTFREFPHFQFTGGLSLADFQAGRKLQG